MSTPRQTSHATERRLPPSTTSLAPFPPFAVSTSTAFQPVPTEPPLALPPGIPPHLLQTFARPRGTQTSGREQQRCQNRWQQHRYFKALLFGWDSEAAAVDAADSAGRCDIWSRICTHSSRWTANVRISHPGESDGSFSQVWWQI